MGLYRLLFVPLCAALWAVVSVSCRSPAGFGSTQRTDFAKSIIADWPPSSRAAAETMIHRYGPPDALALNGLGWKDKGRWQKIVVRKENAAALPGAGSLEQTVAYRVPKGRRRELEAFGDRVRLSPDGSSMSARSDIEALNYLALNLGGEIGRGALDAAQARLAYRKAVELSRAGKSLPLMNSLLLSPPR